MSTYEVEEFTQLLTSLQQRRRTVVATCLQGFSGRHTWLHGGLFVGSSHLQAQTGGRYPGVTLSALARGSKLSYVIAGKQETVIVG